MKCKKCGSNLDIDTAVCPYCGTPNPIAKKHREDMAKYEADYKSTKATVIGNSKHFNIKIFFIGATVVTIALFILLIILSKNSERIGFHNYTSGLRKGSAKYVEEVKKYVADSDYIGLTTLSRAKHMSFYDHEALKKYYYVSLAASNYSDLFTYIIRCEFDSWNTSLPRPSDISYPLKNVLRYLDNSKDETDASVRAFADNLYRDTKALIVTYLGLSDSEYDALLTASDAQFDLAIEEAFNEKYGE